MASLLVGATNLIFSPQSPNHKPKSLLHLSSSSLLFPSNPSSSFPLSFQISTKLKKLGFQNNPPAPLRCSSANNESYFSHNNTEQRVEQVAYPKPTDIPWSKELANTVHLIGNVGNPVQIKFLDSGKVLAWTRLAVRKSPTENYWIHLTFWNELAHVASQHVQNGQRLYVSGRLVADNVQGEDGAPRMYYKVVVKQINFIEKNFNSASSYERGGDTNSEQGGSYVGKTGASTQELWQAFFANPTEWWDNRKGKRSPRYPDFKHKDTGEALWVEASYNPPWVRSQLAILDSRMESFNANENSMPASFVSGDDLEFF